MTRYEGNTGRYTRIAEGADLRGTAGSRGRSDSPTEPTVAAENTPHKPVQEREGGASGGLFGDVLSALPFNLGGLLSGGGIASGSIFGLELADVALLILFLFMYLESSDFEFLIILAFLAISAFKKT